MRRPTGKWVAGVVSAALLAGCTAASDGGIPNAAGVPLPEGLEIISVPGACAAGCREPTVAVTRERVVVAEAAANEVMSLDRSTGEWSRHPLPAVPSVEAFRLDGMVFSGPDGDVGYVAQILGGTSDAAVWLGLQVARSPDGGRSWPINTFVGVSPEGLALDAFPERPWAAFGPDGSVWVVYYHWTMRAQVIGAPVFVADGVWGMFSRDAGRTFAPPVRLSEPGDYYGTPSQPVVLSDGGVAFAYVAFSDPLAATPARLRIAFWDGETIVRHAIPYPQDGGSPDRFPAIGQDATGRFVVAWWQGKSEAGGSILSEPTGSIFAASSPDGRSWEAWPAVNRAPAHHAPSPWLSRAPDGTLWLSWVETSRDFSLLRITDAADAAQSRFASGIPKLVHAWYTDFAQTATGDEGDVWIPLPDFEENVLRLGRYHED